MDEQQVVFHGNQEFVARGRVEAEKAELLREIREAVVGAGRLEAAGSSLPHSTPLTRAGPLPAQQRSEIFILNVVEMFFLVGLLVFALVVFGVIFR